MAESFDDVTTEAPVLEEELSPESAPAFVMSAEDEIKKIKEVIDLHLRADQPRRDIEVKESLEHHLYWKGIQKAIWSEVAHDFQTPDLLPAEDLQDVDASTLTRVINIIKAFGESFIASLSAATPKTRFFPDDADDPEDISTAKGASAITTLIEKQNAAEMKLMKMLWTWYNDGVIFVYNFHKTDPSFGMGKKPVLQQSEAEVEYLTCAECGANLGDADEESNAMGIVECPQCGAVAAPARQTAIEQVPILGFEDYQRSKEIFNVYGILHVRVAPYAAEFEDSPYLVLEFEQNISMLRHLFPNSRSKISGTSSATQSQSRWARLSEHGEGNSKLATVQVAWLRPWAFDILEDVNEAKYLKSKYEEGCKGTLISDEMVEYIPENVDEAWTVSESPSSLFIKDAAPVAGLIPIQDLRTDLTDLEVLNIEQSIPETFVDQDLIDADEYNKVRKAPGLVFPVKSAGEQKIADHFHTLSTATLSKEAEVLLQRLDQDARFVSGIFPAIYGGSQTEGSKTLGEYEMSRNQALQRLSIAWKIINALWPRVIKKCVMSFIKNMVADEKFVQRQGNSFKNVWIRKAALNGKIGEVESETSEQFPTTWAQKRALLLELFNLHNPQWDNTLADSHNLSLIHDTIAFPDLFVPGEDDRNKQLNEIAELLKSQPLPPQPVPDPITGEAVIDPSTGQIKLSNPQSSVPIEYELDNHPIEAKACRDFLVSEAGQELKNTNKPAYMNIFLHMTEHLQAMRMLQAPPPAQMGAGNPEATNPESGQLPDIEEPPNDSAGIGVH
jgi:DNA-directed RNA polymerase subunit RPC12/RpoP